MVGNSNDAITMLKNTGALSAKITAPGLSFPLEAESTDELVTKLEETIAFLDPGDYQLSFCKSKYDSKSANAIKFRKAHFGNNPGNQAESVTGIGSTALSEIQALKDQIAGIQRETEIKELKAAHALEIAKLKDEGGSGIDLNQFVAAIGSITKMLETGSQLKNTLPVKGNQPAKPTNPEPETGNETVVNFAQAMVNALGQDQTISLLEKLTQSAETDPEGFKSKIATAQNFL